MVIDFIIYSKIFKEEDTVNYFESVVMVNFVQNEVD